MTDGKLVAGVFAMTIAVTALQAQAPQATRTAGAADSQTFVNEMVVAGMAEVELGTLATQRAQNAESRREARVCFGGAGDGGGASARSLSNAR
jgi:predicted outer membrane protein